MKKLKTQKGLLLIVLLLFILVFSGCEDESESSETTETTEADTTESEEETEESSVYDSLAVVTAIDTDAEEITMKFISDNSEYVLNYSGSTSILSKYGNQMAISSLNIGDIVEAYYNNGTQKLTTVQIYDEAWSVSNVSNYSIDTSEGAIIIGSTTYSYDADEILVSSEELPVELDDIDDSVDVLTVNGIGTKVYSVVVDEGHGYIVIENQDYFIGGMLEIGDNIIKEIKKNMSFAVPEGKYTLTAEIDDTEGSMKIKVLRNETVTVDISGLQGDAVEKGTVTFDIDPDDAALYIDGEEKNADSLICLEYGRHDILVYLDGYDSYTETIDVEESYQEYEITLDVDDSDDDE